MTTIPSSFDGKTILLEVEGLSCLMTDLLTHPQLPTIDSEAWLSALVDLCVQYPDMSAETLVEYMLSAGLLFEAPLFLTDPKLEYYVLNQLNCIVMRLQEVIRNHVGVDEGCDYYIDYIEQRKDHVLLSAQVREDLT